LFVELGTRSVDAGPVSSKAPERSKLRIFAAMLGFYKSDLVMASRVSLHCFLLIRSLRAESDTTRTAIFLGVCGFGDFTIWPRVLALHN
jgi:hypothetical protein